MVCKYFRILVLLVRVLKEEFKVRFLTFGLQGNTFCLFEKLGDQIYLKRVKFYFSLTCKHFVSLM